MCRFSAPCLSALVAVLAAGCAPPPTVATGPSLQNDYFIPASTGLGKREQAVTIGDGPNGEQVLFVNFDGANILRVDNNGSENSTDNSSWIPKTYSIGQSKAFAAFDVSPYPSYTKATAIAYMMGLVQSWYADFNAYVVSTRPSSGRYTELMVGDQITRFLSSVGSGTVGIATLDCFNSSQVNVGFDFAVTLESFQPPGTKQEQTDTLLLIAQTVAHEAGHTFGLEHVSNEQDIMNPTVSTNVVGFIDSSSMLSDGSAKCGTGSSQNSHARLLDNLGPTPVVTTGPKPIVQFLAPKDGDTVPSTFTLAVSASEPSGATGHITKVEIYQASTLVKTLASAPYQVGIPAPGDGTYTLSAVAYNSEGNKATTTTTFTVSAGAAQPLIGCIVSADCTSPTICQGGSCVPPPSSGCTPACAADEVCQSDGTCAAATSTDGGAPDGGATGGGIGATCTDSAQCDNGGVCAQNGSKRFCTNVCDPANSSACPSSFACTALGGDHYCTPKSSGKGCSFAGWGGPAPASSSWLLGAGLLLLISRRRSRPSAT